MSDVLFVQDRDIAHAFYLNLYNTLARFLAGTIILDRLARISVLRSFRLRMLLPR